MGLAAITALSGDLDRASGLLDVASADGAVFASVYAATLDPDLAIRSAALEHLRARGDDSDALNFLGIAAYIDGDRSRATECWTLSTQMSGAAAPLLMQVAAHPERPPASVSDPG